LAVLTVTAILIDIAVTIVIEIVVALFGDGFGVTGAAFPGAVGAQLFPFSTETDVSCACRTCVARS
tara:strand:- start:18698 stop:18895 length:198 start_codon:yes stop_codon:yes gene_type:complete